MNQKQLKLKPKMKIVIKIKNILIRIAKKMLKERFLLRNMAL